jgi:hypothetical protein
MAATATPSCMTTPRCTPGQPRASATHPLAGAPFLPDAPRTAQTFMPLLPAEQQPKPNARKHGDEYRARREGVPLRPKKGPRQVRAGELFDVLDPDFDWGEWAVWLAPRSQRVPCGCASRRAYAAWVESSVRPGYYTLVYVSYPQKTPDEVEHSIAMPLRVLCDANRCRAVRCRAVLCCDVMCCAVLCCAVLCCAVLCCAVLCHALLFGALPCRAVLCSMRSASAASTAVRRSAGGIA